ncbi:amidohydrolase [Spirosoma validum]|uniref:Amidohydrolase n=1 Tax=Spirosoma validum TaxID=2771355 RepID=A0A927B429_9BACT|nr:amidohydrolase [Spirosoma validum]MBD2755254.1 amidohydrolase [Spirosoma validum]
MLSQSLLDLIPTVTGWRHRLHQFPEVGFTEKQTAAFVAAKLREFGLDIVVEGIGKTGVVGTLRRGSATRSLALRADMDALAISEQGPAAYRSQQEGIMHACGHDGHTSMLLGAAHWLARYGAFDGTVHFIFQPAEEWGKGALAMLADGLLQQCPFDEIYGLHNWPGLPVGHFATTTGELMAAEDIFTITLTGVGGHASRPHKSKDVLVAASSLVLSLQTIVARRVDPSRIAVVSVTEFMTDGIRNALPNQVTIKGDVRSFQPAISQQIETELRRIATGIALANDCQALVAYEREFIPLRNEPGTTAIALQAAAQVFATGSIDSAMEAVTVSEDFAQFLEHVLGNFALLGTCSRN